MSNIILGNIQISGGNDSDGGDDNADDQLRRKIIIINQEKPDEPIIRRKLVLADGFSPLSDATGNNNNNNNNNQEDGTAIVLESPVQKRGTILKSLVMKEVIEKYNAKKEFDSLYRLYAKSPSNFFSMHKSDFGGKPKRRVFSVFRKAYKSTVLKC